MVTSICQFCYISRTFIKLQIYYRAIICTTNPLMRRSNSKTNWQFIEGFFLSTDLHVAVRKAVDGPCPSRTVGFYTQSGCAFRSRARSTEDQIDHFAPPSPGALPRFSFDGVLIGSYQFTSTYLRLYELSPKYCIFVYYYYVHEQIVVLVYVLDKT